MLESLKALKAALGKDYAKVQQEAEVWVRSRTRYRLLSLVLRCSGQAQALRRCRLVAALDSASLCPSFSFIFSVLPFFLPQAAFFAVWSPFMFLYGSVARNNAAFKSHTILLRFEHGAGDEGCD